MIAGKIHLLITFHTTAGAMAMEKRCRAAGLAGRLIPVPREITADCGLAWRGEPGDRPRLAEISADLEHYSFKPQRRNGVSPLRFCAFCPPG